MNHYFPDVPGLGNIAVSRHAQERMKKEGVTEEMFRKALFRTGADVQEGHSILVRSGYGIRIVILANPTPNRGAKLVKTVFRLQAQAKAK